MSKADQLSRWSRETRLYITHQVCLHWQNWSSARLFRSKLRESSFLDANSFLLRNLTVCDIISHRFPISSIYFQWMKTWKSDRRPVDWWSRSTARTNWRTRSECSKASRSLFSQPRDTFLCFVPLCFLWLSHLRYVANFLPASVRLVTMMNSECVFARKSHTNKRDIKG